MTNCLSLSSAVWLFMLGLLPGIGIAITFAWLWVKAHSKWINAELQNIVLSHSVEAMKLMGKVVQAK